MVGTNAQAEDCGDQALTAVKDHTATWTAPPTRTPADHSIDGPLMGNGDMGVSLGGSPEALRFWVNKNDFWKLEAPTGGPRPIGGIDIISEELKDASYHVEQHFADATTIVAIIKDQRKVSIRSWVAATANLFVIELSVEGEAVPIRVDLWAAQGDGSEVDHGTQKDVDWIVRRFRKDVGLPVEAAAAMKVIHAQGRSFELTPNRSVTLVVAVDSQIKHDDYLSRARSTVADLDQDSLLRLRRDHLQWWADYWAKSWVQIGDPILEKAYYQSLYSMGSASRDPEFPPAIFGTWVTTDAPWWSGDYHLNYNHMAPFYGLYSSNRIEQADPQDTPILDFINRARGYARRFLESRGVLYPVGIGPKGFSAQNQEPKGFGHRGWFWGQKSNGAYCLVNMAQRWRCTYDPAYGRKIYPLVKEVIEFWEDHLTFEDGRYVIYNDSVHEGSGDDVNPILTLGLLRNSFDLALDMSLELDADTDRRGKWQHILDHLSGFTTQERDNMTVFRYTERGTAWWNDNTLGIQHIYPGNAIGLDSDPYLLKVSRNTIQVMQRWLDFNGTNSLFPAAVRVGYDPVLILKHLRQYAKHSYPNGFKLGNPHGIENFSTVPNTINEMLCMSHGHVLRLFPVWPRDRDTRFTKLRCWGAFLVSSDFRDGRVRYVEVHSERGRNCTIVNPWPGSKVVVYRTGKPQETVSGDRFTIKTGMGETVLIGPVNVSLKELHEFMIPWASAPRIVPSGGRLLQPVTVTLSADELAEIRYTTDGSVPTRRSEIYKGPIEVRNGMDIAARAFLPDHQPSPVVGARFKEVEADVGLINRFDSKEDFDRLEIVGGYPAEPPRWIDRPGEGVRNPNPGRQGIVAVHPTGRNEVCILKRVLIIPSKGSPRLRIVTSGDPFEGRSDYIMQAGVDDGEVTKWFKEEVVAAGPEPSEKEWKTFEYDLSTYAGRKVVVLIKVGAGGEHPWHNDRGYFDEISVIVDR